MDCREVRELLHPYVDGELAPEEARSVAEELLRCEACKAEHDELQAVRALAREALMAPVEEVDLSGVYGAVMARIAAEAAADGPQISGVPVVRRAEAAPGKPAPGLLDRIGGFLAGLVRFENPMMSMVSAAAAILVVAGLWWLSGDRGQLSPAPVGAPMVSAASKPAEPTNGKRRDRATETGFVRDTRFVTVEEVASGRVEIEEAGGPNEPVVVWHMIDTQPASTPDRL